MKLPLYRYQCPTCRGTLSRTNLYPRPELYEFQFPSYKTPLAKTILAIVIAGFGLAFISLWLATLAVIGIGAWYFWNYHGALQCDQCGEYFISGQFAHRGARRRPWTKADAKVLLLSASGAPAFARPVMLDVSSAELYTSLSKGRPAMAGETSIRSIAYPTPLGSVTGEPLSCRGSSFATPGVVK